MIKTFTTVIVLVCALMTFSCVGTKKGHTGNTGTKVNNNTSVAGDTSKKIVRPQPYNRVITANAITRKGVFTVHKIEERFYFEIPQAMLNKDMLVVNRISKAATGSRQYGGMFGFSGDEIGRKVVQFDKRRNNKIVLNIVSFDERSTDTSTNGLQQAVLNMNYKPIVASFDIKAIAPDSSAFVIDVTDYLNTDNDVLFFDGDKKRLYALGAFQADKSFIETINTFPINVEVKTVKTYGLGEQAKTYQLNTSILLLPEQPMQPRYWDSRVGYFAESFINYGRNPQRMEYTEMITRWRMEPKPEDENKYRRGELVEPQKPIVFYIDPATPEKWVPYLIQGVNDWQKAFEKAGFKNAIYALAAPKNDSSWSLEDARFSVLVYKPSYALNANGPTVKDPRSGEILESHINWYHNVMQLLHDWYMVQLGPTDPRARNMDLDDTVMGRLIRFAAAHEVGHTLGLRHNFGASSTVPVEKLRDKAWVEKNGFCPSIMDYARFNYVAQPGDNIAEQGLFPRIGVYDEWTIEWGYRWLPQLKTEKESRAYMHKWIVDRVGADKRLWFGADNISNPHSQTEDIGDNAVKASTYGINNLQRVMANLMEWTRQPGEDYRASKRIHNQIMEQYNRYLFHVTKWIGATIITPKMGDEPGTFITYPTRQQQKDAVTFLQRELFTTPKWLLDKDIFLFTGIGTAYDLLATQKKILDYILSNRLLGQFEFSRLSDPVQSYSADELLIDLESGIWKELDAKVSIDEYRRNLQKIYVEQLINVLEPAQERLDASAGEFVYTPWSKRMDAYAVVKGHLRSLLKKVDAVLPYYTDRLTRFHLMDIKDKIIAELKTEKNETTNGETKKNAFGIKEKAQDLIPSGLSKDNDNKWRPCHLWSDENELYKR